MWRSIYPGDSQVTIFRGGPSVPEFVGPSYLRPTSLKFFWAPMLCMQKRFDRERRILVR